MTHRGLVFVLLGCAFAAPAWTDTVYLKDGSGMDGAVTYPNENCVKVETAGGSLVFQKSEVDRVEKNDKRGQASGPPITPLAQRHEKEMEACTGLTAEQREQILGLMEPLKSEDPVVQRQARAALIAKNKEVPLFAFLAYSLESLSPLYVPQVMVVLMQIDHAKAKPIVKEYAESRVPDIRAAALEALAEERDCLDLVVRGLVDLAPMVRIAAAQVLGGAGDKRVTPVLIAAMQMNDQRVQNACKIALSSLWSTVDHPIELGTIAEWQSYWEANASSVKNPIVSESLVPLVDPNVSDAGRFVNE